MTHGIHRPITSSMSAQPEKRAGHSDFHAGPDDDDRRESSPQRVAGRENDRPIRPLNFLHDLIKKAFEVVLIRNGNVGGDERIDLLPWGRLRQDGRRAHDERDERDVRRAPRGTPGARP